jgi:regulator of sigma E protease
MDLIFGYIHQGFSFIVPLVILLGLLIFVHELGHFLVAKYYGVRVETFSLGFGKKIFKYKKGDTEYCLSVVPFGGYVKMFGDEPNTEIPESEKRFAFNHKPVGQRIAVVLAGPLMNFFFAIVLFMTISMVGEETVQPVVGDVPKASQAYASGFRTGDRILKVDGKDIISWDDVQSSVESHKDTTLNFDISRAGNNMQLQAKTQSTLNKNILSSEEFVGDIDGLSFTSSASTIALTGQNTAAYKAGLRLGDRIVAVDGKETEKYEDVIKAIDQSTQKNISLKIQPEDEKKAAYPVELSKTQSDAAALLKSFGIESSDLYIAKVADNTPAQKAGFLQGDKIVSIDGKPITSWQEIVATVQGFHEGAAPLKVSIVREGDTKTVDVAPALTTQQSPTGKDKQVYALGIVTAMQIATPATFLMKTSNPITAVYHGVTKALYWTKATGLSFLRLIQNRVSPKSIGGPIMIGQLASRTFQIGLSPFLKIMAIISINLFILNLFPIPILDGGHLVFYIIEVIQGAPLSVRKMEIAQRVGFFILISLMILALFNDVTRSLQ